MMNSGLLIGSCTRSSLLWKWCSNQLSSGNRKNFQFHNIFLNDILFHTCFGLIYVCVYIYIYVYVYVCRIPIWYDVKLVFVAWLVLPQFKGAAFLYNRFVREQIKKYNGHTSHHKSPNGKGKNKFVDFITPKKVSFMNTFLILEVLQTFMFIFVLAK